MAVDVRAMVSNSRNGTCVSSEDTVPFCLWCTAHRMDDYEAAHWTTAEGRIDSDTTCAIVALSAETMPPIWLLNREPLPSVFRLS